MFKTMASMRRFLMHQQTMHPTAPDRLWDRYRIYVECVGFTEFPVSFKEWLT